MDVETTGGRAAAFFDVDGTLLWHDPEIMRGNMATPTKEGADLVVTERPTEAIYDAFRRMRENGHATLICTGRPYFLIQQGIRDLEPTGFIAEAGAYVRFGDEVIRDEHIPFDQIMEAARAFFEAGIDIDIESNELDVGLYGSGATCFFPGSVTVHSVEEFEPYARRYNFAKFCTHTTPYEQLERVRPFCEGRFTICNMQFDTYEFSPIGIDKGSGIRAALDYLGIDAAHAYAFGDSENDLSMADAVGTFVAMGNALPNVKERAGYVTDDARDDGVATGLAHFGLI